ncbi:MAG: hypothetical protein AAFY65_17160 [Pseudomonadota bacterium]
MDCRFVTAIEAMQTKFTALYLNGSSLPGLNAEGAEVKGHIFLRVATVNGEVSLSGAVIGGQLDFDGATLSNKGSYALNAQGAEVKGGVFLRRATTKGEVCLSGAIIGGQLEFNGATLSNEGGYALNAQGAVVKGGLIWREGASCPEGVMDFTAAHVSNFVDDMRCWPQDRRLRWDGLTYDRLYGDHDATARLAWLKSGSYTDSAFDPQPYTHLAKVYRNMGRDGDARRVLFERERRERADLRRRRIVVPNGDVRTGFVSLWRDVANSLRLFWDYLLRCTIGYGYQPFLPLVWLIALWAIAVCLAHLAWTTGTFAPNSGPVQMSEAWQALITCEMKCHENPAMI